MPRATAEFSSAGLNVTPAPTAVTAGSSLSVHPLDWLPSMGALQGSYYALYELLAEAVRRVRETFEASPRNDKASRALYNALRS
jgi:uncharacterized SAM-binding protein YcdF (DUF218 family)